MLSVKYLGHACFTATDGAKTVIIDPFLTGNPLAPVSSEQVKADAILLTHGHGDHIGDGIDIAKRDDSLVVAPYELASYCQFQGCRVHPMHIGGCHEFDFGRVKLTQAVHGSGLVSDGQITYLGNPCGFILHMGGKTIYHAGDTGLFGDMHLIGDLDTIGLAALPIGDNFTMGIDDAVIGAKWLHPAVVVPMHYDTFDVIKANAEEFARKLSEQNVKCVVLKPGEEIEVP